MFDLLIKNSLVVDGTGQKGRILDVGVKNGRVAAIDRNITGQAVEILNGKGLALTPGFIDIHCHTDTYHLACPDGEVKLRQGVCLDVVGNCGESVAPTSPAAAAGLNYHHRFLQLCPQARSFGDYAQCVDNVRPAARVMSHAGHTALRIFAMGHSAAVPDASQLSAMETELARSMEQGAAGMSTGLYYSPSGFAKIPELAALARVAAKYGGFHASHIRNEGAGLLSSLEEVITSRPARQTPPPMCPISRLPENTTGNWRIWPWP